MLEQKNLAIIGAGGHSEVLKDWALTAGTFEKVVRFDDGLESGFQFKDFEALSKQEWTAIIGIGDNRTRLRVAREVLHLGFEFSSIIHPAAIVSPGTKIGAGSAIAPGSVVNVGANIGQHCVVNTSATVDHHCTLEDGVHVGPGANLAGGVRVEFGAFIGIGACVIPMCEIGKFATIGAGSSVVGNVSSEMTVKGNPAR